MASSASDNLKIRRFSEPEGALQMSKEHLDFLATATGLRVFRSCSDRTGHITGVSEQILHGSV
jgi:hypothetical protein